MKITIVVGGRWHSFDLAKELDRKGCLHKIITNYPSWYVQKWEIPPDKIISLPLTFWLVKLIYKLGGDGLMMKLQWRVHSWFANKAISHLEGSELIHGWSQWSEPSLKWAKKRGIPTVLERSSAHILEQSRLLNEEYRRHGFKWTSTHPKIEEMELREYELCSKIAVPSLFVERSFKDHGFSNEKLFKNQLGVNLKSFRYKKKEHSGSSLKIIYVGTMSLRKGVPDLLDGFHQADIKNAELKLVGGMTPELKNQIHQAGKNVIHLDHQPQSELSALYHDSDCFVIASVEEGMAMVQMQALACGLPIICTTNTGGEDLLEISGKRHVEREMGIKQYSAGFLIPTHSPPAIARCIEILNNDRILLLNMSRAAQQLATRELSWENYAERAIENYRRIISKNGK